jgi:hypothetical protein
LIIVHWDLIYIYRASAEKNVWRAHMLLKEFVETIVLKKCLNIILSASMSVLKRIISLLSGIDVKYVINIIMNRGV